MLCKLLKITVLGSVFPSFSCRLSTVEQNPTGNKITKIPYNVIYIRVMKDMVLLCVLWDNMTYNLYCKSTYNWLASDTSSYFICKL